MKTIIALAAVWLDVCLAGCGGQKGGPADDRSAANAHSQNMDADPQAAQPQRTEKRGAPPWRVGGKPEELIATVKDTEKRPDGSAPKPDSLDNLKLLIRALHYYHDAFNSFPPAYTTDSQGKPQLSWRVHIVPFLDQQSLYRQFHLDEPWDSPHNKTLIAKNPPVFRSPESKAEPGRTNYLGVSGPQGALPGKEKTRFRDFSDGSSQTIVIVEVNDQSAAPWTKPFDFTPDPADPRQGLLGLVEGGFRAAFGDGSVHFLKETIDNETLLALFTRNGNERVPVDNYFQDKPTSAAAKPEATTPPLKVSDVTLAEPVALPQQQCPLEALVASPDGRWLITRGRAVRLLWDLNAASPTAIPLDHHWPFLPAFSANSRWTAAVGADQSIRLVDLTRSGPQTAAYIELREATYQAIFSPDGRRLITRAPGGALRLWDVTVEDPNDAAKVDLRPPSPILGEPAISPDGHWLAAVSAETKPSATSGTTPGADACLWDLNAPVAAPILLRAPVSAALFRSRQSAIDHRLRGRSDPDLATARRPRATATVNANQKRIGPRCGTVFRPCHPLDRRSLITDLL